MALIGTYHTLEPKDSLFPKSAVFVSPIICRCRDVTKNAPEKIIWHLPEAKNTVQRKYGKPCENSLVMLQGTYGIWKSS